MNQRQCLATAISQYAASLTDLSSDARTSLIVNQQTQRASGYARWRQDQDPAILDAFPGQEMFRALRADTPRDWAARWDEARAALGPATTALPAASGFLALKNDPIWTAINRFGTPYPPFDFNSGMRVRNVGRRRCRELGLLADEALAARLLTPARDPMDGSATSSSAAGMDPALVKAWADAFGGRARVYAGRDGQPRVAVAPPPEAALQVIDAARDGADATAAFGFPTRDALRQIGDALGKPLRPESPLQISAEDVRHILNAHGSETRKGQRPVTPADIRAIPETVSGPGHWRASTEQEKGGFRGDAVTFVADTGERVCFRVTTGKKDPRITVKTLYAEREK